MSATDSHFCPCFKYFVYNCVSLLRLCFLLWQSTSSFKWLCKWLEQYIFELWTTSYLPIDPIIFIGDWSLVHFSLCKKLFSETMLTRLMNTSRKRSCTNGSTIWRIAIWWHLCNSRCIFRIFIVKNASCFLPT